MPSPIRVSHVEYTNRTIRPRDEAIKQTSLSRQKQQTPGGRHGRSNAYRTIDETFNDSYAQSGIQPSIGRTSLALVSRKKTSKFGDVSRNSFEKNRIQGKYSDSRITPGNSQQIIDDIVEEGEEFAEYLLSITAENAKVRGLIGKALLALAYIKVTRLNISIISWAGWAWINLQLPIAILSIALFGVIYSIENLASGIKNEFFRGVVELTGDALAFVAGKVGEATEALFGFDIMKAGINAITGGFLAMHFVILAIGLLTLMSCYFLYTIKFIRCLSGKGSTGKMVAFLVAIVGYSLPLFNIFPWFIFWVIAVWRYPK